MRTLGTSQGFGQSLYTEFRLSLYEPLLSVISPSLSNFCDCPELCLLVTQTSKITGFLIQVSPTPHGINGGLPPGYKTLKKREKLIQCHSLPPVSGICLLLLTFQCLQVVFILARVYSCYFTEGWSNRSYKLLGAGRGEIKCRNERVIRVGSQGGYCNVTRLETIRA